MGPQLRQRFNLVSGSTEGHLRQLARFGLDRNHVDAVFRTEMGHRQYAHKWMESFANDMAAKPQSTQEEQEPNKDGSDSFNTLPPNNKPN
jgi:hypothetical protein